VAEQAGWRHFVVEQRLLAQGGQSLAATVMALRRGGLKTEPAFAAALKLRGDPYHALLELDRFGDQILADLIFQTHASEKARAFSPPGSF
jgi:hypothetical protein